MSDRMRVGIIGCGALGQVHAARFAGMGETVVVALSDPSDDAMRRVAAGLSEPPRTLTTDYRELLDAGLDIACIASPDAFHVPQVLDALAANLHVLCEKPLTPGPDELEAVIEAQQQADRFVALTYPRRYDAGIRALRREVLSGRWGAVTSVTAYNAEDWITPNKGTWRHDPKICPGGFFYDASGHQIDTVMWITGRDGASVRAEYETRGTPVPMVAWGTSRLSGNIPFDASCYGCARKSLSSRTLNDGGE